MDLNKYKLSCELQGHSLDVRAVTEGAVGSIVSGSRDKSCKIWTSEGKTYLDSLTMRDHSNYVSSVCVLNDGELICSGSNDSTICVYATGNLVPITILRGHTATVSALAPGPEPNTLISGSWDKTARLWTVANFGDCPSVAFVGHEAAIWAVATTLTGGQLLTASADKTIVYWNTSGERLRVLKGHTDCVRALVPLIGGQLLSAGNDAVIRLWNNDGECIREMHGHGNYIYTMARVPGDSDAVVTGGEDSTIRMWSPATGEPLGDAVVLPAQSVWSVAVLRNGDIVTGTSDGIVRVFTADAERMADAASCEAYQVAVQTRAAEASLEIGGVKVNELPGPESLIEPGRDGQTRIVRQPDGKIMCYQWSNGEWLCMGDVMGAAGGSQQQSGKTLHEGTEYDFVFNVDISDTGAPLKLPYNCAEDPWLVAQKFLQRHELPQSYLEQVANFIIKNSEHKNPTSQTAASTGSTYADPFTGDGRYIPGSSGTTLQQQMQRAPHGGSDFVDPFTGTSSYRTAAAVAESGGARNGTPSAGRRTHFPFNVFTTFDSCVADKVIDKIREFNGKFAIDSQVSEETLQKIRPYAAQQACANTAGIIELKKLLTWPANCLFPVLDIARMAVRHETVCERLATAGLVDLLLTNIANGPAANQLMAIRCFANMLAHGYGRDQIDKRLGDIMPGIANIRVGSPNLQVGIATFYLNLSVTQLLNVANADVCQQLTEALIAALAWTQDAEALYRLYRALGNLTCTTHRELTIAQVMSVDAVLDRLRDNMSTASLEHLNEVARELVSAM